MIILSIKSYYTIYRYNLLWASISWISSMVFHFRKTIITWKRHKFNIEFKIFWQQEKETVFWSKEVAIISFRFWGIRIDLVWLLAVLGLNMENWNHIQGQRQIIEPPPELPIYKVPSKSPHKEVAGKRFVNKVKGWFSGGRRNEECYSFPE